MTDPRVNLSPKQVWAIVHRVESAADSLTTGGRVPTHAKQAALLAMAERAHRLVAGELGRDEGRLAAVGSLPVTDPRRRLATDDVMHGREALQRAQAVVREASRRCDTAEFRLWAVAQAEQALRETGLPQPGATALAGLALLDLDVDQALALFDEIWGEAHRAPLARHGLDASDVASLAALEGAMRSAPPEKPVTRAVDVFREVASAAQEAEDRGEVAHLEPATLVNLTHALYARRRVGEGLDAAALVSQYKVLRRQGGAGADAMIHLARTQRIRHPFRTTALLYGTTENPTQAGVLAVALADTRRRAIVRHADGRKLGQAFLSHALVLGRPAAALRFAADPDWSYSVPGTPANAGVYSGLSRAALMRDDAPPVHTIIAWAVLLERTRSETRAGGKVTAAALRAIGRALLGQPIDRRQGRQ